MKEIIDKIKYILHDEFYEGVSGKIVSYESSDAYLFFSLLVRDLEDLHNELDDLEDFFPQ